MVEVSGVNTKKGRKTQKGSSLLVDVHYTDNPIPVFFLLTITESFSQIPSAGIKLVRNGGGIMQYGHYHYCANNPWLMLNS